MSILYAGQEPDTRLGGIKVVMQVHGRMHGCGGRGRGCSKAGARLRSGCGLGCKTENIINVF